MHPFQLLQAIAYRKDHRRHPMVLIEVGIVVVRLTGGARRLAVVEADGFRHSRGRSNVDSRALQRGRNGARLGPVAIEQCGGRVAVETLLAAELASHHLTRRRQVLELQRSSDALISVYNGIIPRVRLDFNRRNAPVVERYRLFRWNSTILKPQRLTELRVLFVKRVIVMGVDTVRVVCVAVVIWPGSLSEAQQTPGKLLLLKRALDHRVLRAVDRLFDFSGSRRGPRSDRINSFGYQRVALEELTSASDLEGGGLRAGGARSGQGLFMGNCT